MQDPNSQDCKNKHPKLRLVESKELASDESEIPKNSKNRFLQQLNAFADQLEKYIDEILKL